MSFGRSWDTVDQIKHPYLILPHYTIKGHFYINGKLNHLISLLKKSDLIIITQYASISAQVAMYFSSLSRKKWVFWSESIEGVAYEQNPLIRNKWLAEVARDIAIYPIKNWASECWGIGTKAIDSMANKMPKKKLEKFFYYSDLTPFLNSSNIANDTPIKFVFLGSVIFRKGFDLLIGAIESLKTRGIKSFEVHVFGEGPLLEAIPENLKSYFILHGFLNQSALREKLKVCHALVFPSRYDGWGLAVIEALAMGLVCIVSSQTGAKEAIQEDKNGWTLKGETPRELADKMKLYIENNKFYKTNIVKQTASRFDLAHGVSDFKRLIAKT